MLKQFFYGGLLAIAGFIGAFPAAAHFGMVIPSDTMVMPEEKRTVHLDFSFSHPFEGQGMPLDRPERAILVKDGQVTDVKKQLTPTRIMGQPAWQMDYRLQRPGAHIFCMEPQPYWEPAEDCYIVHYTKTVVAAFGDDTGWDTEVGLKTEIVPLSKPFGLYAGNVFQGIVKRDGEVVPYAEVEVEYYNENGFARAPTDYMITQTLRADRNGVFTYAAPVKGWWGFAALNPANYQLKKGSVPKAVELGAVLWVKFEGWDSQ